MKTHATPGEIEAREAAYFADRPESVGDPKRSFGRRLQ